MGIGANNYSGMYMVQHLKTLKHLKKSINDYTLCIIYLNALHLKDASILQSCMSEGSLLNSIHPLYLKALLLTHKFCLGSYNLFTLLYLVFVVDISDCYVKNSFMYVDVRLRKVLYTNRRLLLTMFV